VAPFCLSSVLAVDPRVKAAVSVLALFSGLACDAPVTPSRRQPPLLPEPPTAPAPPLECRFDPVSRPGDTARSGFELCFTPSSPAPLAPRAPASAGTVASGVVTLVAAAPPKPLPPCPDEMALVEGEYCPEVRQRCLRYIDDGGKDAFLAHHRCAVFERNPTCAAVREHRRFCIDRDEYTPANATLPLVEQSFTTAGEICQSLGKRLCFGSEWEFACEGEALWPYPYGFERDASRCNHDQTELSRRGKLRDLRVSSQLRPQCTSPFGVRNLVGNVDEWAVRDGFVRPWRSALRGGWWLAGRNNCRAQTTAHDEFYHGPQTGFRCCANAR
jgi:formylglycine-generating enzyme